MESNLKYPVFITSFLLLIYCASGFYLPSYVEELSIIEPKTELIEKLESKIESADEDILRGLTRMMLDDLKTDLPKRNEVQYHTIGMYLGFNKILVGLLIFHFIALFGFYRAWRKK
jgi:hypothetical protein